MQCSILSFAKAVLTMLSVATERIALRVLLAQKPVLSQ